MVANARGYRNLPDAVRFGELPILRGPFCANYDELLSRTLDAFELQTQLTLEGAKKSAEQIRQGDAVQTIVDERSYRTTEHWFAAQTIG